MKFHLKILFASLIAYPYVLLDSLVPIELQKEQVASAFVFHSTSPVPSVLDFSFDASSILKVSILFGGGIQQVVIFLFPPPTLVHPAIASDI